MFITKVHKIYKLECVHILSFPTTALIISSLITYYHFLVIVVFLILPMLYDCFLSFVTDFKLE